MRSVTFWPIKQTVLRRGAVVIYSLLEAGDFILHFKTIITAFIAIGYLLAFGWNPDYSPVSRDKVTSKVYIKETKANHRF